MCAWAYGEGGGDSECGHNQHVCEVPARAGLKSLLPSIALERLLLLTESPRKYVRTYGGTCEQPQPEQQLHAHLGVRAPVVRAHERACEQRGLLVEPETPDEYAKNGISDLEKVASKVAADVVVNASISITEGGGGKRGEPEIRNCIENNDCSSSDRRATSLQSLYQ